MATKIIMAQVGEHVMEGTVIKWLKSEGDPVRKGEAICEVETDKVVLEIEAPVDGILLKIVVPERQRAEVFSVLGIVGEPGEQIDP